MRRFRCRWPKPRPWPIWIRARRSNASFAGASSRRLCPNAPLRAHCGIQRRYGCDLRTAIAGLREAAWSDKQGSGRGNPRTCARWRRLAMPAPVARAWTMRGGKPAPRLPGPFHRPGWRQLPDRGFGRNSNSYSLLFSQESADFPLQLRARAMERHAHATHREVEHLGNLRVGIAFKIVQGEDLTGARRQTRNGAADAIAQLARLLLAVGGRVGACQDGLLRFEWNVFRFAAVTPKVARCVPRRAVQIRSHVIHGRCVGRAANQAHEHGLQDIFGVRRIARNAVGGAQHAGMMRLVDLLQIGGPAEYRRSEERRV